MFIAVVDATTCVSFQFRHIPHQNGQVLDGFLLLLLHIGESYWVTAPVLMLYGTIEIVKIVIFFFLNHSARVTTIEIQLGFAPDFRES